MKNEETKSEFGEYSEGNGKNILFDTKLIVNHDMNNTKNDSGFEKCNEDDVKKAPMKITAYNLFISNVRIHWNYFYLTVIPLLI
jgi:hypothetical protein